MTGLLYGFWAIFSIGWKNWKTWAAMVASVGALSLLLLLPWMLLLQKAIGTPFMPPFYGSVNPIMLEIHSVKGDFVTKVIGAISALIIAELMVFMPIALFFLVRKNSPPALSILLSTLITVVIFAYSWSIIPPNYFYRYTFPFFVALWVSIFVNYTRHLGESSDSEKGFLRCPAFIWLSVLLLLGTFQISPMVNGLRSFVSSIPEQIANKSPLLPAENYRLLKNLQDQIPPGESILVMVDAPYMLDFKRNKIFNVEAVGQCSPWGGLPFFKGPDALKEYLTKNQVKYVIYVKPESAFMYYRKDYWANNPWVKQGFEFIAEYGKYVIDLSDNLAALSENSMESKNFGSHVVFKVE
jgi:hypothetical protein